MIGLLWFDPDPNKSLSVIVRQAKEHLLRKHGIIANCCDVNPITLETFSSENIKLAEEQLSIKIRPTMSVQTNHYFIGINSTIPEIIP